MLSAYKTIIKDFHSGKLPELNKREMQAPINSGKIIAIIGPRRAGKTYYLFQLIGELQNKISKEEIIYINFEDERIGNDVKDLQSILDAYYELYPNAAHAPYFFFDEIQNVAGWEKFVRRIYDTVTKNIFITGSSSKMLSNEIATTLRGRALPYELLPLSFREYLSFARVNGADKDSTKGRARLRREFNRFFKNGGFPECINYPDDLRTRTLQSYVDTMIYRDIVERYEVTNISALRYFIKKNIGNVGTKISFNKIFNELKSQGVKIAKNSIYDFFRYAEDGYLLFVMNMFSESLSMQTMNDKKVYCIDNGLANAASYKFSEDRGHLFENLVFMELKQRNLKSYYFQGKNECDFINHENDKIHSVLQVTLKLDSGNREREITGLFEALKRFKMKEGYILTENQQEKIVMGDKTIHVVPLWLWLLEN
jgi:predicted AAA+ superfamily ATPase